MIERYFMVSSDKLCRLSVRISLKTERLLSFEQSVIGALEKANISSKICLSVKSSRLLPLIISETLLISLLYKK